MGGGPRVALGYERGAFLHPLDDALGLTVENLRWPSGIDTGRDITIQQERIATPSGSAPRLNRTC